MTKFAVHYTNSQGLARVWVSEAVDPEHAKQLFAARVGRYRVEKVKVLRGEYKLPEKA